MGSENRVTLENGMVQGGMFNRKEFQNKVEKEKSVFKTRELDESFLFPTKTLSHSV